MTYVATKIYLTLDVADRRVVLAFNVSFRIVLHFESAAYILFSESSFSLYEEILAGG